MGAFSSPLKFILKQIFFPLFIHRQVSLWLQSYFKALCRGTSTWQSGDYSYTESKATWVLWHIKSLYSLFKVGATNTLRIPDAALKLCSLAFRVVAFPPQLQNYIKMSFLGQTALEILNAWFWLMSIYNLYREEKSDFNKD